ncbi:Cytochrome P450 [Williamsia serinedens]|uniref:Cytochrome P450 n=1 Tax=Williamsia serinedens TaxID=391736 RepID=A0ABT1H6J2_9NOCA|nr:Cytochrome P450 [Williamsia serinedens]
MSTSPTPLRSGLYGIHAGDVFDLDDPYPGLRRLTQTEPVSRIGDSSFFTVTGWDLIAEAVARTDDFSSNLTATMVWKEDGTVEEYPIAELGSPIHVLATADDPEHKAHRAVVMPSLVAKRVRALEPFIDHTLERLWTDGVDGNRLDWMTDVAQRLPMAVVAELLGFPTYDIDDLVRWSFAATILLDGVVTAAELETATDAVGELSVYLSQAFDGAMANPGENVLGDLARLVVAGTLDHGTAVMISLQLVAAGAESTVSLLGSAVYLLGRNPDVVETIRDDRDLVPVFVEEALRLESPFRGHYRHVVADTTLGEVDLPAGSHLYLMWGAANRDPATFDQPDDIDLDPAARRSHMAFGKGLHLCVGAALARLEGRVAIDHLLDRTPNGFTVDTEDPDWERSLLVRRLRHLPVQVGA